MGKALERRLVKLAAEKCQLALANQVRLAKLKLVNLRRKMLCSTPTIDNPPKHTWACTISDVNKGLLHKKPRPVKS